MLSVNFLRINLLLIASLIKDYDTAPISGNIVASLRSIVPIHFYGKRL